MLLLFILVVLQSRIDLLFRQLYFNFVLLPLELFESSILLEVSLDILSKKHLQNIFGAGFCFKNVRSEKE